VAQGEAEETILIEAEELARIAMARE